MNEFDSFVEERAERIRAYAPKREFKASDARALAIKEARGHGLDIEKAKRDNPFKADSPA